MVEKGRVLHLYKTPVNISANQSILQKIKKLFPLIEIEVRTELCYNIGLNKLLNREEKDKLVWLLSDTFQKDKISETSKIHHNVSQNDFYVEVGPRLSFATAFSTNAVSICHGIGLECIDRIEVSRCYDFVFGNQITDGKKTNLSAVIVKLLYDKMTEMQYPSKLTSFQVSIQPDNVYEVDMFGEGRKALEKANVELGLAFDDWDLDYYTSLFLEKVQRNPTSVECFDLAQSNSEHSRHWFFKGKMVIDGVTKEKCLMQMVCDTQLSSNRNNVIKFSDNSSAIEGFTVKTIIPKDPTVASMYTELEKKRHIIFTAETHNFPTGVAPFPGATTGTGGRIRDVQAAGRGAHVVAGTAGYCFGNLCIPGYDLPWENKKAEYPSNFALPLQIAIEASSGASDYGNKFGEPVITGFARSFGMQLPKERCEWIKPIMFSGGIGSIEDEHVKKELPEKGMQVVKVGGPVYRIGVGGGAASSILVQGDNSEELDFGAVQRGDAEMEQKMNRLIRSCVELGNDNPICSIHDQGAGGNGNVLKEISEPAGAVIHAGNFHLGDPTLSLLEIWGAEYQESNAILVRSSNIEQVSKIARREKVNASFVGEITGDGNMIFEDNRKVEIKSASKRHPFDLPLDVVLGKMPQKTFNLQSITQTFLPLQLPVDLNARVALERVLRLPSVASKRYLTNKVDRSVTGLVAQQQCVGPLHTPLSDVAVVALSMFDVVGAATAIGEQPIKCLIEPRKGARLAVAEAFTNLVFAKITSIKDVKCSGNWMWPAKLNGEGARLYSACEAMCEMLTSLGAAVDGGKDSLSMAARVGNEVVKSPGALVVSLYAPCVDVRKTITPDLKRVNSSLLYVKLSGSEEWRLGGTALAQVYGQLGQEVSDVHDFQCFLRAIETIQSLIEEGELLSGHDVSDGGLITTLLEMSFAGNLPFEVHLDSLIGERSFDMLFSEEPAVVLEVVDAETVMAIFSANDVPCVLIGNVKSSGDIVIRRSGETLINEKLNVLRSIWEETSFQLERLQCNVACVEEEEAGLSLRHAPSYQFSFDISPHHSGYSFKPKVAILREEGSNGDREMASAFQLAGFQVCDVTMNGLCEGTVSLESFRGLVLVGGFSYADVFGSAKGWAALAIYNKRARQQLEAFRQRSDTFSLGVCNGCQLMALLGWVGDVCFSTNVSERFESRFVNVKIVDSPCMMFKGMQDACLGVWVAHGEGKLECMNDNVLGYLNKTSLIPLRYVDDGGEATLRYPLNPNGSSQGIAGLCSPDGRHLAMMPHPERCFRMWQWPWKPTHWNHEDSPWLQMFYNAYDWCVKDGA